MMKMGTTSRTTAALVVALAAASAANGDIRYWVGDLFDWWDDDAMWATGPNGAGGAGMPGPGDVARGYHGDPSTVQTILYRNGSGQFTDLLQVDISGFGTGSSGFIHFVMNQDTLRAGTVTFGRFGNTTVTLSDGWLAVDDWLELGDEFNATTCDISGDAIVTCYRLIVGRDGGGATLNHSGGSVTLNDLNIPDGADAVGTYNMTGGVLYASRDVVVGRYNAAPFSGLANTGTFDQSGGQVTVEEYLTLGDQGEGTYLLRGGELDVFGRINLADYFDNGGRGVFTQSGGMLTAPTLRFYEPSPGFDNVATFEGGTASITNVDWSGSGDVIIDGGDVTVTGIIDMDEPSFVDVRSGLLTVSDFLLDHPDASVRHAGGTTLADDVEVDSDANWVMTGGTLNTAALRITGPEATFGMQGGTVLADAVVATGDVNLLAGDIEADMFTTLLNTDGRTRIAGGNLYASTISNNDVFRLDSGLTAGGMTSRGDFTLGLFTNTATGELHIAGGTFGHDLVNYGEITLDTTLYCEGKVYNRQHLTLDDRILSLSTLFENTHVIHLNMHAIGCSGGEVVNTADPEARIVGPGAIMGDFRNHGTVEAVQFQVQGDMRTNGRIDYDVDSTGGGTVVVFGTATMDGTARFYLDPGDLPSTGVQWPVISANAINGEFAAIEVIPPDIGIDIALFTDGNRIMARTIPGLCAGDVDGDRDVDFSDLNALLDNWGVSGVGVPGDLNDSGRVDFGDLNILLDNWGLNC